MCGPYKATFAYFNLIRRHVLLKGLVKTKRLFSWFGILALIQSIVNPATIGPIVFFVGLQVNEEALNFMPNRQYAAYIIGVFPSIFDWVTNISNRSPLADDTFTYDSMSSASQGWYGLLAWKNGALLISLLWTRMLVMIFDRKWLGAAIWSFVASLFAVVGIIHSFEAGFSTFSVPVWQQCSSATLCWEFGIQWMFFAAYSCVDRNLCDGPFRSQV
jgi:hypothetical protein